MSNQGSMIYPDGKPVGRYSAIGNDVLEKVADIELTRAERSTEEDCTISCPAPKSCLTNGVG